MSLLLYSNTRSRAARKATHILIKLRVVAQPALGAEFMRLGEDGGVHVVDVDG